MKFFFRIFVFNFVCFRICFWKYLFQTTLFSDTFGKGWKLGKLESFPLSWAPQARSEAWEVYPLEVYHPDYTSRPCRRRPSDDNDDIFTCWVPFHQDTSGTGRPPLASHLNIRSVEAMLVSTTSTSAIIRSDYCHTWRQQECPPCMGQWSNRPEQWCRFPETPLKDSKYLMEEKVSFFQSVWHHHLDVVRVRVVKAERLFRGKG